MRIGAAARPQRLLGLSERSPNPDRKIPVRLANRAAAAGHRLAAVQARVGRGRRGHALADRILKGIVAWLGCDRPRPHGTVADSPATLVAAGAPGLGRGGHRCAQQACKCQQQFW